MNLSRTARICALALSISLLGSGVPVVAQDGSPTTSPTLGASPDLIESLPDTLAGLIPEVEIIRGEEHFDDFDADIGSDIEERAGIEAFLLALDLPVEDMTSVSAVAFDDETFAFLAGLQVAGADQETLLDLYLLALDGSMTSPFRELGEIGGKMATRVIDEGDPASAPVYVYGTGDTVWLIAAEESVVEDVLAQLP